MTRQHDLCGYSPWKSVETFCIWRVFLQLKRVYFLAVGAKFYMSTISLVNSVVRILYHCFLRVDIVLLELFFQFSL